MARLLTAISVFLGALPLLAQSANQLIEPNAGNWKTWIIVDHLVGQGFSGTSATRRGGHKGRTPVGSGRSRGNKPGDSRQCDLLGCRRSGVSMDRPYD